MYSIFIKIPGRTDNLFTTYVEGMENSGSCVSTGEQWETYSLQEVQEKMKMIAEKIGDAQLRPVRNLFWDKNVLIDEGMGDARSNIIISETTPTEVKELQRWYKILP